MPKKQEPKFRKVTINIPVSIFNDIDKQCIENGTNMTTEILLLIRKGMEQENAFKCLPLILQELTEQRKSTKTKKSK